jgi:agmatinase
MKLMKSKEAFLGLDECDSVNYNEAKAVIIPYGLEKSVSYSSGTKKGPQAMIKASHEVELFDEELWCETFRKIGIVTLEEPKIPENLPEALKKLEDLVERTLNENKFPFIFGGEHSITAGTIRPFAKKYKNNLTILHFDAHADLRDGYDGEHYSHASALRRCLDDKEIYNEGRDIKLVSCGIRNISAGEIPFLENNKDRIKIYFAKDKKRWNIDEIASHLKGRNVYLTFDVDAFDSSLMPATGTPEPGGIFWNEAIEIIYKAAQNSNIVGADINELAPIKNFHSCDFLAAKLAYKILSFKFCKN